MRSSVWVDRAIIGTRDSYDGLKFQTGNVQRDSIVVLVRGLMPDVESAGLIQLCDNTLTCLQQVYTRCSCPRDEKHGTVVRLWTVNCIVHKCSLAPTCCGPARYCWSTFLWA